ncbi:MAG: outer membrane beta-barrel protein [Gammaproteobacteria bacterium]|nr:outer membrane beta-barrel protein [Gammaproteobacteria bacterium]
MKASHDDNINLSIDNPVDVWGSSVSPMLDLTRRSAASTYGLGGRLIFNRYSENSVQDTNIQLLTFVARTATRLSRFGLSGSYKRDTTFATIADPASDDADQEAGDVDAGLIRTQVKRSRLLLRPSWKYNLSEVTSINLRYVLNDATYTGAGSEALNDFRRQNAEIALMRQLSERSNLTATVGAARYTSEDGANTDDYSASAGFMHEFSPMLHMQLGVGVRSATSTFGNSEVESSGGLVNARFNGNFSELTTYRITVSQSLQPSGVGALVQSKSLNWELSHDVSEMLSVSLWGSAFRNQSIDFFSSASDRTHYDVEPGFRWNLDRDWSIDGSYRYRWQEYDGDDDAASSSAVYLAVNYAWPRLAVSR